MTKQSLKKEYRKLWGHLKDTPMAKNVYSLFLKALARQKDEFTKTLNSGRKMYLLGKKEAIQEIREKEIQTTKDAILQSKQGWIEQAKKEARQELIDMVEGKIRKINRGIEIAKCKKHKTNTECLQNKCYEVWIRATFSSCNKDLSDILTKLKQKD